MKGSELFVRCLENEDVEYIFGIPGEENIAVMDVLLDSFIQFITTRHEQGLPSAYTRKVTRYRTWSVCLNQFPSTV